jgi:hypothetical protein
MQKGFSWKWVRVRVTLTRHETENTANRGENSAKGQAQYFYGNKIWMQVHGGNVFRRVDDGALNIEVNSSVNGWDDHEVFTQRIRNYTAKPIEVEVRRPFAGHVDFRSSLPGVKLFDFQTVEFTAPVAVGKKADCLFEILRHQGRNSKQNNITLVTAAVVY